ncbi:MAG: hypothetical protein PHF29_09195 [Candidatus Riflebacteria bacterium]|nr:hypothetical protein [Candidatus Riflebacteria bacterium]
MNFKYKNMLGYLIAFITIITAGLVGCGDSGSGRQTLPGENPFGPYITGTGTGTTTATGTSTGTGTDTDTSLTPEQAIKNGSDKMLESNYIAAVQAYTTVIYDSSATAAQKQEAYSGRGWAKAKLPVDQGGGTIAAIPDLKQASNMTPGADADPVVTNESKLGYALALIQLVVSGSDTSNDSANLNIAINIIETLLAEPSWNGDVIREKYQSVYVTAPGARAMLALAYDLYGNTAKADYHIAIALADAPNDENVQKAKATIDILRGNI